MKQVTLASKRFKILSVMKDSFVAVAQSSAGHPALEVFDMAEVSEYDLKSVKADQLFDSVNAMVDSAGGQRSRVNYLSFSLGKDRF
jgi:hypothetical protein